MFVTTCLSCPVTVLIYPRERWSKWCVKNWFCRKEAAGMIPKACRGFANQAWRQKWVKTNLPQLLLWSSAEEKEIISFGLLLCADFIVLCFEEAVYVTWPIDIAPKGGPAADAGPAELISAGSCSWGGRKVQPSLGLDSNSGGGLRPAASEDKGIQSCDWRRMLKEQCAT